MIELETMKNLLKREQWIKNEIDYMINEKEKVEAEYSGAGGMKISFEGKAPYKTNHDSKLVELTHRLGFKYIYNGMNLLEYIEYMKKELKEVQIEIEHRKKLLNEFEGIQYDLFKAIVFEKKSNSKAVEEIAEKYNKTPRNIWGTVYKEIKEYIIPKGYKKK